MTTKVPAELSSTPSIVDNGNATALTINSSENAKFEGLVGINKDINASVALSVGSDATSTTSYGLEVTNSTANTRFLVNGEGSSIFYKTDNSEGMRFNASTGGLTFGGDTAAANTLDDYEEGTYTPVMNSSNLTYTYQNGWYVKIGSHVTVGIHIDINTNGNGSGVAIGDISLPFAPSLGGSTYYAMTSTIWCNGWSTATKSDVGLVSHDYSYIVTRKAAGQGGVATPTHGDLGGGNMLMTVSYKTA